MSKMKCKRLCVMLTLSLLLACMMGTTAFAAGTGDVAGAGESTWATASTPIKTAEESGLSREDYDAAFEQSTGSSVSDYVAEQISQLDEESLLSSLEEDEESGVYKAADGKLYFEEQEADFSEEDYVSYTLEGGKLTFTSVTGDAMDLQSLSEMLGDLFPMVFTKQ